MYKLDRVKKVCLWSVGFDQVRLEKAYTPILLGSSTFTKRIGALLPSLNLGRAGGRAKNMKRRGFSLQRNESNCIFWREIASLNFSIFDEYSTFLTVVYIIMLIIINYFMMSNISSGDIKLRLRLNFQPVKSALCNGNKLASPLFTFSPARPATLNSSLRNDTPNRKCNYLSASNLTPSGTQANHFLLANVARLKLLIKK